MGQGTESTETCADRPTEVSVIRFVSKNHTIEEIAPKKEVYICKQRGCGKVFTNQDDYKSHEALESLKVRFVCREPGCGKEFPDPGRMWWHYQEWHNNDTNVFVCPYTKCGSTHATNDSLQEHVESTHRQLPRIPTEPEIICFEGTDSSAIEEQLDEKNDKLSVKRNEFGIKEEDRIMGSKLRAALQSGGTSGVNEFHDKSEAVSTTRFPKNKDLLITKESFLVKYEARSAESAQIDSSQQQQQEHRIDLGNMEKVFRNGFERDSSSSVKSEVDGESKTTTITTSSSTATSTNGSDDEEYTPKKQRISRSKQEPYRCEINGCRKTFKNKTHFRHHQDSHKLVSSSMGPSTAGRVQKQRVEKPTSISFFLCKYCGAQLSNATALHKHYHETHANSNSSSSKQTTSAAKGAEMYRCKVSGCDGSFATLSQLSKHLSEAHSKGNNSTTMSNNDNSSSSSSSSSSNVKTGNGSGVSVEQMFRDEVATTAQRVNLKTDLKAKQQSVVLGLNDKSGQSTVDKDESGRD